MGGYRLIHLPEQLVIVAKWCEVKGAATKQGTHVAVVGQISKG